MPAKLAAYGPGRAVRTHGAAFGAHSWLGNDEGLLTSDDELTLVADVRLDDRRALCDELGIRSEAARTIGDADLLLHAYKRWGEQCADRLTGDYVFAVWDAPGRTLTCFRDPVGARPLYYARQDSTLVFGSAVGAVLAPPFISAEWDYDVVATLLVRKYQWDVPEHTCFKAVRRLAPGHAMIVKGADVRSFRHWRPEAAPDQRLGRPDTYAEALLERVRRAVEDRMRGDSAVGAHLSGGLDSSGVAVLAVRHARRLGTTVPTFTQLPPRPARLPKSWMPAYAKVDAVRRQEGLRVNYSSVCSRALVAFLRRDAASEGPAQFADDCVFDNAAKEGVSVLLTGMMGDEFASGDGIGLESHLLLTCRWGALFRRARDEGVVVFKWAATDMVEECDEILRYIMARGAEMVRRCDLIDPALRGRANLAPRPAAFWFRSVRDRQLSFLRTQQYAYRFEAMAAVGAHYGIECRHPLADRRIIEFALGLPPDLYRHQGQERWLMRRALRSVLPSQILECPSKEDPAHTDVMARTLVDCLPDIRKQIAEVPSSRTQCIDLASVRTVLDTTFSVSQLRKNYRYIDVLRFLDF